jgi:serine/threonine protein kinase
LHTPAFVPSKEFVLNGKGSSSKQQRPDRFGPFAVRTDLGASRFGPVYLGHDPSTNTRVVIRTFQLSKEWREFGDLSDLLNSFRKLCETKLDYPGLARPLAFGAERNIPYVVYSHLAGTAMDALMQQDGPRPVTEVLQRATQMADAIDFAASAGVHHGMLAPCDVMLEREWTGVTGFGLAQALIKVGVAAEIEARYGSPQRLAGAPPTRADDIYSLAAITLELLIGTPKDPEQELREAQGLPERRRVQRPAQHETRMFTRIAGVDAGKLRACFAAAFSDEPSERPATAGAFVSSFEEAFSNKREAEDAATGTVPDEFPSEERADPPSPPVLHTKRVERVEEEPPVDVPSRQEREPIVEVPLFANLTPPPESPARLVSRALLVAVAVAFSFGAGFGGGFIVGQRSKPSDESTNVSHHEPVAEPQATRAAAEDPKPIAPTTPAVAPTPIEKETISEPIAAPAPPQPVVPAIESGRLVVHSTPAGAGVVLDGQSRGVTPLALSDVAFGAHRIEVSHPGEATRWLQVTLTKRRPTRSVDFDFRPTTAPANDAADINATGSLQVASRPAGAQVFVDDNLIGTTPLLISNVAAGSKRLRIEMSGYKTWTTPIQIEPSARSRVSASLEP